MQAFEITSTYIKNSKEWEFSTRYYEVVCIIHHAPRTFKFKEIFKMKYGNDFYMQLSRHIFDEKYKDLSINAKWLYVVLNELEQRYVGKSKDNWFFRSNEELAIDAGMSLATLKRAKAELRKSGLVKIGSMHWVDKKTGKKSEKKVTSYTIPRSEPIAFDSLGMKKYPYM